MVDFNLEIFDFTHDEILTFSLVIFNFCPTKF